jgi:hypothetical protein
MQSIDLILFTVPPVPPAFPDDESLLSDAEIRRMTKDGNSAQEQAVMNLRSALMSSEGNPVEAVNEFLRRWPGARSKCAGPFLSAATSGRVSSIIFTLNRILACWFWESEYRFAAWEAYLESIR